MAEQLYINTDILGDETYIGSWEEWLRKLAPNLDMGYREYRKALIEAQSQRQEVEGEEPVMLSREEWIRATLEECLVPVDGHSGKYKKLYK